MQHTTTSGPQHLRALARANEVRLARAELKRRILAGDVTAAEVIRERLWETESMTVADLLMAQSRWGRTRCRTFLQRVPLSETKTIGSMTERQRSAVAMMLEGREPAPASLRFDRGVEPAFVTA